MKVGFATTDGKKVDSHFGRCECFSIFEIDEKEYRWTEAREVSDQVAHGENVRIERRVDAVRDCTLLFINQIGPAAAAQVTRAGVMPLKVEEGADIIGQLERLQEMLKGKPPLWLAKAMRKSEEEAV